MQSGLQAIAYSKISLNPNCLVTCIIHNTFVSSPIRLIILDVQLQKFLYIWSNLGLEGPLVYPPRGHCHSNQNPNVHRRQVLTSAQERNPSCIKQSFHPHCHQGMLKSDTPHALTSRQSAKRLTTWIIRTSVGRSILFYIYMFFKEMIYHKLATSPISWLRKLIGGKIWGLIDEKPPQPNKETRRKTDHLYVTLWEVKNLWNLAKKKVKENLMLIGDRDKTSGSQDWA